MGSERGSIGRQICGNDSNGHASWGKKPISFRLLDSSLFSVHIPACLQICVPACCGTPNLLIAALIDF